MVNRNESSDFKEGQRLFGEPEMPHEDANHSIDDLEKQHPMAKKLPDESVANMPVEAEEPKASEPEMIKPDHDTNDSAPEAKETTIKEEGSRRKVLCVVIPLVVLMILGGVGAYLAYFFTHRTDGQQTISVLNLQQMLSKAFSSLQTNPSVPDAMVDDYSR